MIKVYYDEDADLNLLEGTKIAIIGYGAQGRCQALNLRDSGLEVVVSELPGTVNYEQAVADGFKPVTAVEAAKDAMLIQMLVQDHVQPAVFKAIAEHLTEGKALIFSHGFNIHYNQIIPPKNIDVFMVAPKSPGTLVRSEYEAGRGVPCLIAVYQDYTKKAKDLALAYAKGIGGTRAGVIETTFKEETETDLFGEQAVLCGGVSELVLAGFETLVAGRLSAGDGLFRVPARTEAHRRYHLRQGHRDDGLRRQRHRRIWRLYCRPESRQRTVTRRHAPIALRHPGRHLRQQLDSGKPGRPPALPGHAPPALRAPDRRSRQTPARHDALDARRERQAKITGADPIPVT